MNVTVLADEATAAGWRLAGAHIKVPEPRDTLDCFRQALGEADIVLVTTGLASRIPAALLEPALLSHPPLLLVIPDVRSGGEIPDIAKDVARALGVGQ